VVIPGRGIIDHAAAELVAEAIRSELRVSTQCPSLGGLTGISTVVQAAHDARMDIIVLVSVGELTGAQLDLLVSRAKRVFEGSAIVVGHWGGSTAEVHKEHGGGIFVAETVDVFSSHCRTRRKRADHKSMSPTSTQVGVISCSKGLPGARIPRLATASAVPHNQMSGRA
jgi:hypothetical protein